MYDENTIICNSVNVNVEVRCSPHCAVRRESHCYYCEVRGVKRLITVAEATVCFSGEENRKWLYGLAGVACV